MARPSAGLNLARFDLVSIRLVVLCAQTGSLSSACRAAYLSKSSASERLSSLEEVFGARLFVRGHRGLQLTTAGRLFTEHGAAILREIDQLTRQLTELAPASTARCGDGVGLGSLVSGV